MHVTSPGQAGSLRLVRFGTITLPLAQLSQLLPTYFGDWSILISYSGVHRCMFNSGDVGWLG